MKRDPKASTKEKTLNQLLSQFDKRDKRLLALLLVEKFELDENGEEYSGQIEKILDRKLVDDEEFKLDILYRILNYFSFGGGFLDGDADPPPPPPPAP